MQRDDRFSLVKETGTILVSLPGPGGATGPQGPIGPAGPPGPTGAQGPAGPPGETGTLVGTVPTAADLPTDLGPDDAGVGYVTEDTGDMWLWDGTQWTNVGQIVGPEGPMGPTGPAGPQGPQGDPGPAGADSTVPGPQGPPGADGAPGEAGPPGADGADGAPGADSTVPGPPGAAGAPGPSAITGAGVPADTVGTVGQFYVDTNTRSLYGPKLAAPIPGVVTQSFNLQTLLTPGAASNAGPFTNGAEFTVAAGATVSVGGIRYYRMANDADTLKTVKIWASAGSEVINVTNAVTPMSPAGWQTLVFSPMNLTTGTYIVAFSVSTGSAIITPGTSPPIPAVGNVTFTRWMYQPGANVKPTFALPNAMFVEPIFTQTTAWPIAGLDPPNPLRVRRAYITSGNVNFPNTSGAWQILTTLNAPAIPATAGDYIEVSVTYLADYASTAFFDIVAVNATGGISRYLGSGTGSPLVEGNPGFYPDPAFNSNWAPQGFVVTNADLTGGNVQMAMAVKTTAVAGGFLAQPAFPFYWQVKNLGQVT